MGRGGRWGIHVSVCAESCRCFSTHRLEIKSTTDLASAMPTLLKPGLLSHFTCLFVFFILTYLSKRCSCSRTVVSSIHATVAAAMPVFGPIFFGTTVVFVCFYFLSGVWTFVRQQHQSQQEGQHRVWVDDDDIWTQDGVECSHACQRIEINAHNEVWNCAIVKKNHLILRHNHRLFFDTMI